MVADQVPHGDLPEPECRTAHQFFCRAIDSTSPWMNCRPILTMSQRACPVERIYSRASLSLVPGGCRILYCSISAVFQGLCGFDFTFTSLRPISGSVFTISNEMQ
jgi:hypothetical protein